MRMVKLFVLTVLGVAFVVLGVANMTPVELRLLPEEAGVPGARIAEVPLSAVILGAAVVGILVGQLMEWVREAKHRRLAEERSREVGRLRRELRRLGAELGDRDDDLPQLPVRR